MTDEIAMIEKENENKSKSMKEEVNNLSTEDNDVVDESSMTLGKKVGKTSYSYNLTMIYD